MRKAVGGFAVLLLLSSTLVYAYTVCAKIYNIGVAPVVATLQWVFVLTDFVYRATVPFWNAWWFLGSRVLTRILVPFSFNNLDSIPEVL